MKRELMHLPLRAPGIGTACGSKNEEEEDSAVYGARRPAGIALSRSGIDIAPEAQAQ